MPFVTFAYNTAKQASTGFTPFEVLFGRKAKLPLFPDLQVDNPKTYETEIWVNYLNEHIPLVHVTALQNIKKAQAHQKRFYDKGKRVKHNYQVGDLIARKNLEKTGFPKERWSGPWVVASMNNKESTSYKIYRQNDSTKYCICRLQTSGICAHGFPRLTSRKEGMM